MLEVPVPLAFWVTLTEKVDGFEKLVCVMVGTADGDPNGLPL